MRRTQTLRDFRDSYLAMLPNGQEEIEQYYQMAPGIVATIDKQNDREEIWNQVYMELVEPCVHMIHSQENESATSFIKHIPWSCLRSTAIRRMPFDLGWLCFTCA